jgi:glycosyltransferase involved in cell wall biosynthesis
MKKVSVIIPCFKYAHFLKDCVNSVKRQTYENIEIIVVSDGSPDDTVAVCKELGVTCLEKENGGLSSARNYGIKHCTGDYVTCLDADDMITPGAIEEHVKLMDDDYTIAQCSLMQFGTRHNIHIPQGADYERLLYGNTVFCNAMFSKKAWAESRCGFDEHKTMRLGLEDYLFWLDLTKVCKVNTSDFIALRYRQHDNNMTSKTTHPNWPVILAYMREIHPLLKAK